MATIVPVEDMAEIMVATIVQAMTTIVLVVATVAQVTAVLVVDLAIVPVDHIMVASTTEAHAPTTTAIADTAVCVLADHVIAGTTTTATTVGAGEHQSHLLSVSGVHALFGTIAQ